MTLPQQVDVLIVGAGPAGLAAANALVKSDAEVLMVDARERIGYPLRCAELTRANFFKTIGFEPREEWIRWRLSESFNMPVLNRPRMENDMARILADEGIVVRQATSVFQIGEYKDDGRIVSMRHGKNRYDVFAKMVIAADGISSQTARLAGLPTRLSFDEIGSCVAYRISDATLSTPSKYIFDHKRELNPFYFWVIPSGAQEAHVGLGVKGLRGHAAKPLLDRLLKQTPDISGGRITDTIVGSFSSVPPMEKPYANGLLVAGAAARFTNAFLGEGIWQAAMSGRSAAKAYLAFRARGLTASNLAGYRQWLDSMYGELNENVLKRRAHEQG